MKGISKFSRKNLSSTPLVDNRHGGGKNPQVDEADVLLDMLEKMDILLELKASKKLLAENQMEPKRPRLRVV